MSSIVLNSYKLFCVTENADVYTYGYQVSAPTVCPHDLTHTINPATVTVVGTYTIPGTFIITDTSQTSGNLVAYGLNAEFPATTKGALQEWPINALPFSVRVSTITISPGIENYFDTITVYMPFNETVGTLTSGVSAGINVIQVNATAYAAIYIGYTLSLTDGSTFEEFQTVIGKNPATQEITLSSNTVNSYSSGSTVKISVPRIQNLLFNSSPRIILGSRGYTPFLLSAGSAGMIRYTNADGRYKHLNLIMEYYY